MADLVANAFTIIERILQNVETAQRNKEQCQELGQFLRVLAGALDQLPCKEMMRRQGTRDFLHLLEDSLRQAYELVKSCQQQNSFFRFWRAQTEARQLREVQERIQSYLLLFPVISHAHLADDVTHVSDDDWSRLKFYGIAAILFVGAVNVIRLLLRV